MEFDTSESSTDRIVEARKGELVASSALREGERFPAGPTCPERPPELRIRKQILASVESGERCLRRYEIFLIVARITHSE